MEPKSPSRRQTAAPFKGKARNQPSAKHSRKNSQARTCHNRALVMPHGCRGGRIPKGEEAREGYDPPWGAVGWGSDSVACFLHPTAPRPRWDGLSVPSSPPAPHFAAGPPLPAPNLGPRSPCTSRPDHWETLPRIRNTFQYFLDPIETHTLPFSGSLSHPAIHLCF